MSVALPPQSRFRREPDDSALATWWAGETLGTRYWRCEIPGRHLPGQVLKFGTADLAETGEDGYEFPWQRGAAIWQFSGTVTMRLLSLQMQENGTRVLVEVDDDYLTLYPGAGRNWHWREKIIPGKPGAKAVDHNTIEGHRRLCETADGVIVSTPHLASRYRHVNPNVFVCPNSVDPDDWPAPEKPDDGVFRVGWAGSASHVHDWEPVRRALSWCSRQPGVEVVFIGQVPDMGVRGRRVPWTDSLHDYRVSLAQLNVGVCPLVDTEWARGKSDVKALEYAMAAVLPAVSRVEAYKPWWQDDRPCLSAATSKEFEQQLRWAVRHRDEVRKVADEARQYVLNHRTIDGSVGLWREAVNL